MAPGVERVRFSVEAMVRGYHAYKDVWDATIGEQLPCQSEHGNAQDAFAVAVLKDGAIVGHVPRKISAACSMFLRRGGSISCQVTESKRYSADLPQGGLEMPCMLVFVGSAKDAAKVEKLVRGALPPIVKDQQQVPLPPSKMAKIQDTCVDSKVSQPSKVWLQLNDIVLRNSDKDIVISGGWLSDLHINYAQRLLKRQFPKLNGLKLTLYQSKEQPKEERELENKLQIIHSQGNHWIVASTIKCEKGQVKIYDSIYNSLDTETVAVVANHFQGSEHPIRVHMAESQKQDGICDCGLFAIANATAEAFDRSIPQAFDEACMRDHLIQCFEKGELSMFPATA